MLIDDRNLELSSVDEDNHLLVRNDRCMSQHLVSGNGPFKISKRILGNRETANNQQREKSMQKQKRVSSSSMTLSCRSLVTIIKIVILPLVVTNFQARILLVQALSASASLSRGFRFGEFVLSPSFITTNENDKASLITTVTTNSRVYLETSPLIGGPKWLPIHVKVVLSEQHATERKRTKDGDDDVSTTTTTTTTCTWDLIPLNATDPQTMLRLVTLQQVPADARCRVRVDVQEESSFNEDDTSRTSTTSTWNGNDDDTATNDNYFLSPQNKVEVWSDAMNRQLIESADRQVTASELSLSSSSMTTDDSEPAEPQQQQQQLHLLRYNCWTHAFRLVDILRRETVSQGRRMISR